MKKQNKSKGITLIVLISTIIILLILAAITILHFFTNMKETEIRKLQSSDIKDNIEFSYEKNPVGSNKIQLFIIVKEKENGLNEIEYPDGNILNCNGRKQIAIDYEIENVGEYKFKIISNNNYVKEVTVCEEDIDLFGELVKDNKNLDDFGEYGVTLSRSGKNQYAGYNKLYFLGMGSGTGVNRNKVVLTIDYATLISKLGTSFKGIHGEFYHYAYNDSKSTSWVKSQIIVTYDDDTKIESPLRQLSAYWTHKSEEYFTTVMFEENKNVSKIEMIIDMYDAFDGGAAGAIKNIRLIK